MQFLRSPLTSICLVVAILWFLSVGKADELSHIGATTAGDSSTSHTPRYAVIDLGAGMIPLKLTNSGIVLMTDGNGNYYRWQNGISTPLILPSGFTELTDMTEDGTAVGDGISSSLTSVLLTWSGTNTTSTASNPVPQSDGSSGAIFSPLIDADHHIWSTQVRLLVPLDSGRLDIYDEIGVGFYDTTEIGSVTGMLNPSYQSEEEYFDDYHPQRTPWYSGDTAIPQLVNSKGMGVCLKTTFNPVSVTVDNWEYPTHPPVTLTHDSPNLSYILSSNGSDFGPVIPFEPVALNNNGCVVGAPDSSDTCTYWDGTTTQTLPTGFSAGSLNAALDPISGANAYQILGTGPSGLQLLEMDPQSGQFPSVPFNLSDFLPPSSSWSAFSNNFGFGASQLINDGGTIVATAQKSLNDDGTSATPLYPENYYYPGSAAVYPSHAIMLLPVKVTWETLGDNTAIDDNKDPVSGKPMPGGGKCIYPDKKIPTDTETGRNKVTLRVAAGTTIAGWKVYVKAFDIDDPTPDSVDIDVNNKLHLIDSNDTDTIKQGNDNFPDTQGAGGATIPKTGFFTHGGFASDDATLDANGKADFEFNVGYQPGNNYRVAVTFLKVDDLNKLQVTDSTQPCYVPPEENSGASGFSGAMSPPLTVWRRLWVEQDSMAGITGNSVQGTIQSFVVDGTNNQTTVVAAKDLGGDQNQFENGNVLIDSTNYPVVSTASNTILITGQLTTSANGKIFTLKDDDGWGLPDSYKSMPQFGLVDSRLASDYSPAYILVVDAAQRYPHASVPFILNGIPSDGTITDSYEKIPMTSATCWTQYILVAYQSDAARDGDPDTEGRDGGEHSPYGFNVLYLEDLRDQLRNRFRVSFQIGLTLYMRNVSMLTAHELGHGPGSGTGTSQHAEGGIMQNSVFITEKFYSTSILRFRMSKSWSND